MSWTLFNPLREGMPRAAVLSVPSLRTVTPIWQQRPGISARYSDVHGGLSLWILRAHVRGSVHTVRAWGAMASDRASRPMYVHVIKTDSFDSKDGTSGPVANDRTTGLEYFMGVLTCVAHRNARGQYQLRLMPKSTAMLCISHMPSCINLAHRFSVEVSVNVNHV